MLKLFSLFLLLDFMAMSSAMARGSEEQLNLSNDRLGAPRSELHLALEDQKENTAGKDQKENTAGTGQKENTAGKDQKENTAGKNQKENTAGDQPLRLRSPPGPLPPP